MLQIEEGETTTANIAQLQRGGGGAVIHNLHLSLSLHLSYSFCFAPSLSLHLSLFSLALPPHSRFSPPLFSASLFTSCCPCLSASMCLHVPLSLPLCFLFLLTPSLAVSPSSLSLSLSVSLSISVWGSLCRNDTGFCCMRGS